MYYKVIKNKKVIDVLDGLQYVKFQFKNKILLLCDESEAQGVLSSTGDTAYHIKSLAPFPVDLFDSVTLEEITQTEYGHLRKMHCMTPEEIIDEYTLELISGGILQ